MVKRFHDTEIWKQDWFLEMENEHRILWLYIKDNCDHAGIWKPEKKFVEFLTGKEIDLANALVAFNHDKHRIELLPNGRWFLKDFIAFQYGRTLNGENRLHASIKVLLEVNEVNLTSIRGLTDLKVGPKDKDKDKKDVSSKEVKEGVGETKLMEWFEKLWPEYPQKGRVGKKLAFRYFSSSVKTLEDAKRCARSLDRYLESKRVKEGFIQNATTWFNNWQDWENYVEEKDGTVRS